MATILDGKALAEQCKQEVKKAAETLARRPGLAVIIVGNNPASRVYVNSNEKTARNAAFSARNTHFLRRQRKGSSLHSLSS